MIRSAIRDATLAVALAAIVTGASLSTLTTGRPLSRRPVPSNVYDTRPTQSPTPREGVAVGAAGGSRHHPP